MTRRRLLAAAGAGALGVALDSASARAQTLEGVLEAARGRIDGAVARGAGNLVPELTTVTDRGFAAWWLTEEPSDTTVRVTGPGGRMREITLERDVQVHVAKVGGLRPGTPYRYQLRSGGRLMGTSDVNPGRLETLHRPPGRRLATIAVINDLHVGERCSGTATNAGGSSVPPCFTGDDYAARMTAAAVAEIAAQRPDFVLVNGDLTDRGRPEEVRRALDLLTRLRVPWQVTRGNHDRRLPGAAGCGSDGDCLRAMGFPQRAPGDHALTWSRRVGRGLRIVALDSCDPDTGEGRLDLGGQLEFLDRELSRAARERRQAIVAFHHPVTPHAIVTAIPPVTFGVDPARGGSDCLEVLGAHDNVALVLHGHTHRNCVTYDHRVGLDVPFLECGAVKEYPAGWSLLHVHTGGVMRTFHRMDTPFAREWTVTTSQEYHGRQPEYTRGPLSSRAFVHRKGCDAPTPPPSLDGSFGAPGSGVARRSCR